MSEYENGFMGGLIVTTILVLLVFIIIGGFRAVYLSQKTANKICQELTNNSNATGHSYWGGTKTVGVRGGLVCEMNKLNYNHTKLITFVKN